MSTSPFLIDGPDVSELENTLQQRHRQLIRRHRDALEHLDLYVPHADELPHAQSFEDYLNPVVSHRRGLLGKFANVVLGKLYGAMRIFLRPLLSYQQGLYEAVERQFSELRGEMQQKEKEHVAHIEELKQAIGVQNALFSEQVEMMRRDIEQLHEKRFGQLKQALVEIGKAVTDLSRRVAQQQQDLESAEEKHQLLESSVRQHVRQVSGQFDALQADLVAQKEHLEERDASLQQELEAATGALKTQLVDLVQSTQQAQQSLAQQLQGLRGMLDQSFARLEQLGTGQDLMRHDFQDEMQQLRDQSTAFEKTHEQFERQYDSIYRTLVFLQRYIGDQMTTVDYEKLYQPGYFEGEMYDDYLNAKGVFEQFSVLLEQQFDPSAVLDLGCAYGFIPQYYQEQKAVEAYGIDISEHAVKKLGLDYLHQGDLCDISGPYGDKQFDLILSLETFEHLIPSDVDRALDQIETHASGFVLLLISTSEVVLDCVDPFHFSLYTRAEWNDIFAKRGWMQRLDEQRTTFFNEQQMSKAMKWAGRFWVFDFSS